MKLTTATAALMASSSAMAESDSFADRSHPHSLFKDKQGNARKLSELQAFQSNPKVSKEEHTMEIAKTLLKNKKDRTVGSSAQKRGQTLQKLKQTTKLQALAKYYLENPDLVEECDIAGSNPDSGILSCGQGRYCLESEALFAGRQVDESLPAGLCVDADAGVFSVEQMQRSLQDETPEVDVDVTPDIEPPSFNDSIIADMYEICYQSNITADTEFVQCDCQDIDVEAYSGSLSCTYTPICGDLNDICQNNVTFCYSVTYDLAVSAPYVGGFSTMYEFTAPNAFSYSYGIVYNGNPEPESCDITFDGVTCNSCAFSETTYADGEVTECITFDCTNTNLGLEATLCDYTIIELTIADYLLYGSLPCDNGCFLCGEGNYMTNTYANVTFPTGEIYACGLIEISALAGYFEGVEPDLCQLLPPLVNVPCGCTGDANFTLPPTEEVAPTDAPVGIETPTDAPAPTADLPAATPQPTPAAGGSMLGTSAAAVVTAAAGWLAMA